MRLLTWKQLTRPAVLAAVAGVTLVSACSRDENLAGPPVRQEPTFRLELEVSSLTAPRGQRIAVAITNFSSTALGGLQGRLLFDPAALRFVGQDLDADNSTILNTRSAATGLLSVISVNLRGKALPARTATLAFEVLGANYGRSLRYELGTAAGMDGAEIRMGKVGGAFEARDLAVSFTAKLQTDEDWLAAVAPALAGQAIMPVPGANISGIVYGDCNESLGNVNVGDVLCIQRVAANLDQPLTGTDAATTDAVIAANVAPANCAVGGCLAGDFGEPGDATPPGINAGGSATNIDSRTVNVSDALPVAQCAAGLPGFCPPTTAAGPWTTVVNQIIPGREASQFARPDSTVNCPILASTTLNRTKRYVFPKIGLIASTTCEVGTDGGTAVVLTIDAGALLVVDSVPLVIKRNAQIFANGTLAEPIVMTCVKGQLGLDPAGGSGPGDGIVSKGCWGGLYINGNAPVNNGTATSPVIAGRNGGGALEAIGEGASGLYGGDNLTDNSGVLRFVIVEGGGSRFTTTNERNGFTLQALGSGTTIDYVMSTTGLDDGIEFFGGNVNLKHAYVENTEDDSFDWVAGWRGKLQFGIARGCTLGCDNGIEGDNFGSDGGALDPESAPRSSPTLYNMTLLGTQANTAGSAHGLLLRANTAATIRNILVFGYRTGGLDIDSTGQGPPATTFTTFGLICTHLGGAGNGGTPIGNDSLSVRFGYFGNNAADGDPDSGDPRPSNCGGYTHAGSNLEAAYMAVAGNSLFTGQGPATGFLVDPWGTVPDFRLSASAPAGALSCATPPSDGFFVTSATYCGAVGQQNTSLVNLPWYSGWTNPRTP